MTRTLQRLTYLAGRFVLGLVLAAPLFAQEQTTAVWHGILRNSAGAPIAGAKLQLAGTARAESSTATNGTFALPPLPPGKYRLTIAAEKRTATYAQPIELASAAAAVAVTLSDGGEITVAFEQGSSATGEALSSQKANELPLNKRDFSQLLLLAAGTMTDPNGATNFTQQFAINGQRGVEAVFAMDGADISDPEMGGSTFSNFNVDAVQEIQSMRGTRAGSHCGKSGVKIRTSALPWHEPRFEDSRGLNSVRTVLWSA